MRVVRGREEERKNPSNEWMMLIDILLHLDLAL